MCCELVLAFQHLLLETRWCFVGRQPVCQRQLHSRCYLPPATTPSGPEGDTKVRQLRHRQQHKLGRAFVRNSCLFWWRVSRGDGTCVFFACVNICVISLLHKGFRESVTSEKRCAKETVICGTAARYRMSHHKSMLGRKERIHRINQENEKTRNNDDDEKQIVWLKLRKMNAERGALTGLSHLLFVLLWATFEQCRLLLCVCVCV